jgi:hypothetical protein
MAAVWNTNVIALLVIGSIRWLDDRVMGDLCSGNNV